MSNTDEKILEATCPICRAVKPEQMDVIAEWGMCLECESVRGEVEAERWQDHQETINEMTND